MRNSASADSRQSRVGCELTLLSLSAARDWPSCARKRSLESSRMPVAVRSLSGTTLHGSAHRPREIFTARPCRCSRLRKGLKLVQAAKTADGPSVAIVGVTGAVGKEFLRVSNQCIGMMYSSPSSSLSLASTSAHLVFTSNSRCCNQHGRSACWLQCISQLEHQLRNAVCVPLTMVITSLQVIRERDFPYSSLKLLASGRCVKPMRPAM